MFITDRSTMVACWPAGQVYVFEYLKPWPMVLICSISPSSIEIAAAISGKRPVELRIEARSPRFGEPWFKGADPGLGGPGGLGLGNCNPGAGGGGLMLAEVGICGDSNRTLCVPVEWSRL